MRTLFALVLTVSCPWAMADELWVGCYTGDNVQRFDLSNGSSLGAIGAGRLDGPLGMKVRGSEVFVSSELTGSVEVFSQGGAWSRRFATAVTPTGLDFDASGNAYVAEFDTDSIAKYSTSGTLLGSFVTGGSGGLNGPDLGVTFGPDGNLYVPSFWSGDVLKYNGQTGSFMGKFIAAGSGGMSQPRQILWRDGLVYVTSDNGNRVLRYDAVTGAFVDTFVSAGSGGLSGASGMVFHGNSLYVTSWRNNRILRYDGATGSFQSVFASGISGPVSLAVVPEPATLLTLGTLSLFFKRMATRRRR